MKFMGYSLCGILLQVNFFFACSQIQTTHNGEPNGLINESSPYLLQHAYNPVDWQPWRNEVIETAKSKDKLLVISIGYAACHWCHVMEKESFSDSSVAKIMNDNFVSIKVDREERPDVDKVYMDAAMLINGRGGWPLNIIALPDGKPVYAGTYFPKDNWLEVLNYFKNAYQDERQKLIGRAEQITNGVASMELIDLNPEVSDFNTSSYIDYYQRITLDIDFRKGGRKGAPKFPTPTVFESLLLANYHSEKKKALDAVNITLEKMANGGIYDHLGGGFSRYSTDVNWKVPHFEKMLYDNAQLLSLYSHAYQATKKPVYEKVVKETIDFMNRELRDDNGGYYSSLDADSEGEEGKYYLWTSAEIDETLGDDSPLVKEFYQVTASGNWEKGNNILYTDQTDVKALAEEFELTEDQLLETINDSREKLLKVRSKRVPPPLDDKILTSLNGLAIRGLVDAYFAFQQPSYLNDALKAGQFLVDNQLRTDGGLNRNFKDGRSSINAFLDDYAFTIEAFVKLYQATFDEKWLNQADQLVSYVKRYFQNEETQMFYYTSSEDDPLIARKTELTDNDIPSSNSSIAHSLFQLGHYFYRESDINQAKQMLNNMIGKIEEYPFYYSSWVSLYGRMTHPFYEVAIVGEESDQRRNEMFKGYLPNAIIMGGKDEGSLELLENKLVNGRTMIYVCENKTCRLPVTETEKALPLILKNNPRRSSSGG